MRTQVFFLRDNKAYPVNLIHDCGFTRSASDRRQGGDGIEAWLNTVSKVETFKI